MGVAQRTGVLLPSCPDLKLALVLGERALFVNGDLQTARRWFDSAYRLAELCGDPSSLARAALGLDGIWVHEHRTCAESEMVRARQRHALAEALSLAHHCLLGPGHAAIRLELASELIGQAAVTERGGDLLMGLLWRTVDLYLAADPHAERGLEELRGLLAGHDHLAVGYVADAIEVMLTIRAGRFAEAEKRAGECFERGVAAGDMDATGWYGGQLGAIRWFQGRAAELLPVLSDLVSSPTLSPIDNSYLAGLALAAAVAGDRRAAAGHLARLRVEEMPGSSTWLVSMYCVVETAHLLQDPDTAARAYALLRPFADLPVVASLGVACFGSAHHSLGMAALTTGDLPTAVEHLRAAVRGNLALEHWPAAALSRWRLGQALALRDGVRDQAAAREQAVAAREARELGMVLPAVVGRSSAGRDGCRLRRHGRRWQVELGGRLALVDHSVGMGAPGHAGRQSGPGDPRRRPGRGGLDARAGGRVGPAAAGRAGQGRLPAAAGPAGGGDRRAGVDERPGAGGGAAAGARVAGGGAGGGDGHRRAGAAVHGERGAGQDRRGQGDQAGAGADLGGGPGDRGGAARHGADGAALLLPAPIVDRWWNGMSRPR
ncbi:hypothetical protein ACFPOI_45010 [Nonomuraea angiospora]|uniref:Uncharacterized protein n=1 Tax=Nonomuraea angiospora TaxID=46172 RepID=A0ABR9LZG4_9ACTN|nr:hypothetical protein [Nonomuraea angiospora]MBE1586028.1 hypothetical protein [Nonomuraea angiospora]